MASGLAYCTFSVLHAWATHAGVSADDLALEVRWTFADNPHRVDELHLLFDWPSLPAKRRPAALRVSRLCAVHATLTHPPRVIADGFGATDTSSIEVAAR